MTAREGIPCECCKGERFIPDGVAQVGTWMSCKPCPLCKGTGIEPPLPDPAKPEQARTE